MVSQCLRICLLVKVLATCILAVMCISILLFGFQIGGLSHFGLGHSVVYSLPLRCRLGQSFDSS